MGCLVAKVAIAKAIYAIDKPYDYLVPKELEETLRPGMRVLVPFGAGNRGSCGRVTAARGFRPLPPPWTRSPSGTGTGCVWPCGCGSGTSALSMTV